MLSGTFSIQTLNRKWYTSALIAAAWVRISRILKAKLRHRISIHYDKVSESKNVSTCQERENSLILYAIHTKF